MRRDFSQQLIGIGDVPLTEKTERDAEPTPILLYQVCIGALTANTPEAQPSGHGLKAARFSLAIKLCHGGELDVSASDVELLQRLIEAAYPMQIVGPAWMALEKDIPEAGATSG